MKILLIMLSLCVSTLAIAQKVYSTRSGKISFYSSTPVEDIKAINSQVDAKLAPNGQMVFKLLINGFVFPNAKMQEHFNENYMESAKFPKAIFQGNIDNIASVNFEKDGSYTVTVSGTLEIHGKKNPVKAEGTITILKGEVSSKSKFKLALGDYDIKGKYIGEKIAKEIEITVDCKYE